MISSEVSKRATFLDNLLRSAIMIFLKVLNELACEFLGLIMIGVLVRPCVNWHEDFLFNSWDILRHSEIEAWHDVPFCLL